MYCTICTSNIHLLRFFLIFAGNGHVAVSDGSSLLRVSTSGLAPTCELTVLGLQFVHIGRNRELIVHVNHSVFHLFSINLLAPEFGI